MTLKWKLVGFIDEYPSYMVRVRLVYIVIDGSIYNIVLVVTVGQPKGNPSTN